MGKAFGWIYRISVQKEIREALKAIPNQRIEGVAVQYMNHYRNAFATTAAVTTSLVDTAANDEFSSPSEEENKSDLRLGGPSQRLFCKYQPMVQLVEHSGAITTPRSTAFVSAPDALTTATATTTERTHSCPTPAPSATTEATACATQDILSPTLTLATDALVMERATTLPHTSVPTVEIFLSCDVTSLS